MMDVIKRQYSVGSTLRLRRECVAGADLHTCHDMCQELVRIVVCSTLIEEVTFYFCEN